MEVSGDQRFALIPSSAGGYTESYGSGKGGKAYVARDGRRDRLRAGSYRVNGTTGVGESVP